MLRKRLHWGRRAAFVLRTEGLGPVATKAIARLRIMIGLPDGDQRRFLHHKAETDAAFDGAMGTDTGGIQTIPSLTIMGSNAQYGIDHIACDPVEFDRALSSVDIAFESATFLDLGAGKGRALMLAARYPFAKIVGVEFAWELHVKATENIRRAGADPRITIIYKDVTEIVLPDGPQVIFMFNPFDAPIVRRVASNSMESYRADPRPIRILYLNPRCADAVREAGWKTLQTGDGYMLFSPPA